MHPPLLGPALLGFDPGRAKCGLAVVGLDKALHYHQVIPVSEVTDTIQTLRETYPISGIVLGDQTGSKHWQQALLALPNAPRITLVDERYSSLEARDRYWQMYPPKGVRKLIPKGLRSIPRPIDDIVAILLVERYLKRLSGED
ncbi:MAG: resolvase [Phormidesmis sp. RL_2_1]|nr:resolvase [Phormidesmis sp. RL_2_1]